MGAHTSVVMINWNGAQFLRPLLDSVISCNPAEIVVIDNQSSDDSLGILETYPSVKTIANPANLGFGTAANQGIQLSSAPFVLVMNVDMIARPGSIDALEQYLLRNDDAAVAAPQLIDPDGSVQRTLRSFPTIHRIFMFLSFLDRLFPTGYMRPQEEHAHTHDVEQPMGAALMFRRAALQQTGSFDPQFFMYMEEVDLCERLVRSGWKISYVAEAQMVHHAGGSSKQAWARAQTNYLESVIRYFRKRCSSVQMMMLRAGLATALLLRSIVVLAAGRLRQALFYARAAVIVPFKIVI